MENGSASGAAEPSRWLAGQWSERLAEVLESVARERPAVSVEMGSEPPETDPETVWWRQEWNLAPRPLLWAGVPKQTWSELGRRALRAAGIGDPSPDDARQMCLDLLRRTCAGLALAISVKSGRETFCGAGAEGEAPPPALPAWLVKVAFGGAGLPALRLSFDPLLAGSTLGRDDSPDKKAASETMDLLLDVELPVSISFGRAQIPLEEVLRLTAGSVIELDRAVNDPVEVVVNNCVVALGEMVVVDGNYGVRIQRLLSRQERPYRLREPIPSREMPQKA